MSKRGRSKLPCSSCSFFFSALSVLSSYINMREKERGGGKKYSNYKIHDMFIRDESSWRQKYFTERIEGEKKRERKNKLLSTRELFVNQFNLFCFQMFLETHSISFSGVRNSYSPFCRKKVFFSSLLVWVTFYNWLRPSWHEIVVSWVTGCH